MIPRDYITEWRKEVPWIENFQVEQDLVISRALVDIFHTRYSAERYVSAAVLRSTNFISSRRRVIRRTLISYRSLPSLLER